MLQKTNIFATGCVLPLLKFSSAVPSAKKICLQLLHSDCDRLGHEISIFIIYIYISMGLPI